MQKITVCELATNLFFFFFKCCFCENSLWFSCFSKDGHQKRPSTTSAPYIVIIEKQVTAGRTYILCVHVSESAGAIFKVIGVTLPLKCFMTTVLMHRKIENAEDRCIFRPLLHCKCE